MFKELFLLTFSLFKPIFLRLCGYSDWQKDVEKDITKDTCEDQKTNVGEKDIVKFKLDKNSNKMTVGTKIYTRVE